MVNPIPSLPTDNLYKFCAVAGGVAIIVSGLVLFQAWRDILRQQQSVKSLAAEKSEQEFTLELADMVSKPWWQPEGGDTPEAAAAKAELQEQARRIKSAVDEVRKKLASDEEALDLAKYDFGIVGLAVGVVGIVGFVLASYGFYNWRKLQLKQDELLEFELQERRAGARSL
jgi:hypothetical protein